jgi:glycyl-tRNA synthetase beta chain
MTTRDLLIEIGTEELPPKSLRPLSDAFAQHVTEGLQHAGLQHQAITAYATPRRLALLIKQLQTQQAGKTIERRGPALQAAFDAEGQPTPAALGFAKSCGVDINAVEKLETDKGAWLVFRAQQAGQTTAQVIPPLIQKALDALPIAKRMRWADRDAQFVRPVHWIVLLFGDEVIDCEILSVRSGRETRGHRFLQPMPIFIPQPSEYEVLLESKGKVIASFARRKQTILAQIEVVAHSTGGRAIINDNLLDEVTAMVEWPTAVLGSFEPRYLSVPKEALISTMAANQRYFHLVDNKDQLLPHFITISNIEHADMSRVRTGNERVIRPRFADAEFFWNQDRRKTLASRHDELKTVLFQQKLGSLFDKTQRLISLAGEIAQLIGGDKLLVMRAAELCKCDLVSNMVGEFPELQGVMGRYYAAHDKEPGDVAAAIDEHYLPRFAGDQLPVTRTGQALAIADRLDTLVGIFAIGEAPTGEKDPFGLRRAALGVLRILIEKKLLLDLHPLLAHAATLQPAALKADKILDAVLEFILERMRAYYLQQGIRHDVLDAVKALRPTSPADFDARVHAVTAFQNQPAAQALAAANKRISNILKKNPEPLPSHVNTKLLQEAAEIALAESINKARQAVAPLLQQRNYPAALTQLAQLRDDVDRFFDGVMVMADDKALRLNRLALLANLRSLFLEVADISHLQTAGTL